MFTGIVEKMCSVVRIEPRPPGQLIVLADAEIAAGATIGDSIALSGCCLTVAEIDGDNVSFEAGPETLVRTTLGALAPGDAVNVERSLRLGDQMGGHWVTGHVDGVGMLAERQDEGEWSTLWFTAAEPFCRQMASKGSIAVAGVSLTLVDVETDRFSVALIPHTLAVTTLGRLAVGDHVNLETDVLAKYVERQLTGQREYRNADA